MQSSKKLKSSLIAPCGMNCGLCMAYQRTKNRCSGCITPDPIKVNHCSFCRIKYCEHLLASKSKYCGSCNIYPCFRIKKLDKRYRTRYGMSMIENLNKIKESGIRKFVEFEKQRWACSNCGNIICVHKNACMVCGTKGAFVRQKG